MSVAPAKCSRLAHVEPSWSPCFATSALPDQETGSWQTFGAARECSPSEVFSRLAREPPATCPRPAQRGTATSFRADQEVLFAWTPIIGIIENAPGAEEGKAKSQAATSRRGQGYTAAAVSFAEEDA